MLVSFFSFFLFLPLPVLILYSFFLVVSFYRYIYIYLDLMFLTLQPIFFGWFWSLLAYSCVVLAWSTFNLGERGDLLGVGIKRRVVLVVVA